MAENNDKKSAGAVLFIEQFDAQLNKEHKNVSGNPIFKALVEMESDQLRIRFIDIAKRAHDKLITMRSDIQSFIRKNATKNVLIPADDINSDGTNVNSYPNNVTMSEQKVKELRNLQEREQKLNAALLKALDPKDGMNKISFDNVEKLLK